MTITKKSKWAYKGPVKLFDHIINSNWEGATWAPSEAKALANLSYQFKSKNGMVPGTRISLNKDYLFETTSLNDDYEYYDEEMRRMIDGSS